MEWGAFFLVTLFEQAKRVTGRLVENIKAKSLDLKASQLPCIVRLNSNFYI
jgi:hypothetical protein